MIVNLRAKLAAYRRAQAKRRACQVKDGHATCAVFSLGEYNRLLAQNGSAWVQAEQTSRRRRAWTPADEREFRELESVVGHLCW